MLTFGDSKETEEHNAIAMCSSDVVVYVANRKIYGPVLIMSCSYRYSSFVAAKNNGAKDGAMSLGSSAIISFMQQVLILDQRDGEDLLPASKPNFRT
jgi:hypothetical protein